MSVVITNIPPKYFKVCKTCGDSIELKLDLHMKSCKCNELEILNVNDSRVEYVIRNFQNKGKIVSVWENLSSQTKY